MNFKIIFVLMMGFAFNCYAGKCFDAIQKLDDANEALKTYSYQIGGAVATEDALNSYDKSKSNLDAAEQKWAEAMNETKANCTDADNISKPEKFNKSDKQDK